MLAMLEGRTQLVIEVAALGDAAASLLGPLRARRPRLDTVARMPAAELGGLLGEGSHVPGAKSHEHMLLAELPDAAIDALLELDGEGSPLVFVELRRLGGALAEADGTPARSRRSTARTPSTASGLRGRGVELPS